MTQARISPLGVALAAVAALVAASPARAQSLLDRPPNISGGWTGASGVLYFHFLHRFTASGTPERKVGNVPTFLVALGLPARTLLGFNYTTNSTLAPRYPNEWEFFARYAMFDEAEGAPLTLAGQVGYNIAAEGADGEISLARRLGPVRVLAAARVLADPYVAGRTRFALGGGGTLRIARYLALAGDAATLLNSEPGERIAWSGGLHVAIPYSPHTFSLQATNVAVSTLQGISRGDDAVRYGFEFTIPITLRRYFGGGQPASAAPAGETPARGAPAAARPDAPTPDAPRDPGAQGSLVKASMRAFAFTPSRIEITAGTTVEWTNADQVAHTVTAVDRSLSSPLIDPGGTWRHTFDRPGTYDFFCMPHPFMKGVVVVR